MKLEKKLKAEEGAGNLHAGCIGCKLSDSV